MEYLLANQYTWTGFFTIALELLALYFVLQFAHRILANTAFLGRIQPSVQYLVRQLLLLYEPLVILILSEVFVLVNPVTHGLVFLLLLLVGFPHIRNYLSGRLVQFNRKFTPGTVLRAGGLEGIITRMGRLGLFLQTNEGMHFLSFSRLLSEGYTLVSGEEIGGFYTLRIQVEEGGKKNNHAALLKDLLAMTPYVDWNHPPEVRPVEEAPRQIDARVMVKEESHLHELMALVREWGYSCSLKNL